MIGGEFADPCDGQQGLARFNGAADGDRRRAARLAKSHGVVVIGFNGAADGDRRRVWDEDQEG